MGTEFTVTVTVSAATLEQAEHVISSRLSPDEDYGFEYGIDWVCGTPAPEAEDGLRAELIATLFTNGESAHPTVGTCDVASLTTDTADERLIVTRVSFFDGAGSAIEFVEGDVIEAATDLYRTFPGEQDPTYGRPG